MGLDSLMATQLAAQLTRTLGRPVLAADLLAPDDTRLVLAGVAQPVPV
jgi:hypothetical protein